MIINADSLAPLPLADRSVQMCVTSPPYWGLRDYGITGQLGLEATPAEFVAHMVSVFAEVRRVLRDDGTLWLNLGDSYSSGGRGSSEHHDAKMGIKTANAQALGRKVPTDGFKDKDLIGIPWRVALALQADGWYLRSDIVWSKPNPMPESVTDRPTKSHEYLFLLAKSARYYYDAEAIKEPSVYPDDNRKARAQENQKRYPGEQVAGVRGGSQIYPERNRRTVWEIPTAPYSGAHFATFPPALVEPCILAGSKAGDIVLDPFAGSGTTGQVARLHGRRFVGLDLNAKYLRELALPRAEGKQTAQSMMELPMFAQVAP